MPHPPDRDRPFDPGHGPIEPGSVLHRLLVMVAKAIAHARSRNPSKTDRVTSDAPANDAVPTPGQQPTE
jgi:hypothetical protein